MKLDFFKNVVADTLEQVNKTLTIKSGNEHIENISIYNSSGNLMLNKKNVTTINIEDYPNGVYYLKIMVHNSIIIKKIYKYGQ